MELFAYFYFIKIMIPWRLTKQAYADKFDGFNIDSLKDLEPGRDPYLDHLCNCFLDPENTVVEGWPDVVEDFQAGLPHNMAKEKV